MLNIFLVVFFSALSFAFLEPFFFVGYLISIALFGLYQALFMANAGGAWDNAKKVVETELHAKGTPLHDACVVGDTVGDPFKDTSSVAVSYTHLDVYKRQGYKAPDISILKQAYQLLYKSNLKLDDALARIESQIPTAETLHLVGFIRRSQRGICRE